MTQSIIIFVIVLIVQAIASGIAKKKEAEKAATFESQRLRPSDPAIPLTPRTSPTRKPRTAPTPVLPAVATSRRTAVSIMQPPRAQRKDFLHQAAPLKVAERQDSDGESTFEDLAKSVAQIRAGVLRRPSVAPTSRQPAPRPVPHSVPRGAQKRVAFNLRQAMIAHEIFSSPLAVR